MDMVMVWIVTPLSLSSVPELSLVVEAIPIPAVVVNLDFDEKLLPERWPKSFTD
jgi:hypothetical protein